MSSLNIKTLAVAAIAFLHLKDASETLLWTVPTDGSEKQPVGINVYGPGSKEYQAAQTKVSNRNMNRLRKHGKYDQSPEDKQKEQAQFLADITHSFSNVDYDGKTGRDLALAVYGDTSLGFIADQVADHIKEWGNFSPASATT